MDKEKALEILGLREDASSEEIEKRILVLYKKFKQGSQDSRGYTIEDVEKAYKTIRGITYTDVEEEKRKQRRKKHPNPLFKLLNVDEDKARNFIYYYKWYGVAILLTIAVIVSMIYPLVNSAEPDLKIIIGGNLFISDTQIIEEEISSITNGSINALVQNIYFPENRGSPLEMGMHSKFTVEVAAGKIDIFILDEEKYMQFSNQGAFLPVEEVLGDISLLGIDMQLNEDLLVSPISDKEEKLYGIDISDNQLLREAGVKGKRMILTFGYSGENLDNTINFVNKLLK
ncbi:MAG TPA: hypothetical protein GXZ22_00155 [Clostridiaceae bacterium]|jgi:hypothetical protein|nr:hypothetical protein [Clostridiaceae bacterium]